MVVTLSLYLYTIARFSLQHDIINHLHLVRTVQFMWVNYCYV
jgi:hypothetical protein